MGPSISKSKTSFDAVNEIMTSINTEIINKFSQSVSSSNYLRFKCSDAAYKICIEGNAAYKKALAEKGITDAQDLNCCTIKNVKQANNVSISTTLINDNSIANSIQTALLSKVDEEIKASASGSVILNQTETDRHTRIKNVVKSEALTKVINETLLSFNFSNHIDVENGSADGIEQSNVITVLSSNIAKTMLDNNAELKSDIDALLKLEDKTSGGLDNLTSMVTSITDMVKTMFTGPMAIIAGIIFCVLLAMWVSKNKGTSLTSSMFMPGVLGNQYGNSQFNPYEQTNQYGNSQFNPYEQPSQYGNAQFDPYGQ